MGIRRKKITDRRREAIEELLSRYPPRLVYGKLLGTRDQVSLSTIYNIRRQKTGQPMTKQVVDTSQLDVAQRKQLSDFLTSLSLPSPFLIRSVDFFSFAKEDTEHMVERLYRGECSLEYAAPFLSHRIFGQAKKVFHQEAVWSELCKFPDDFNGLLADCSKLWCQIYQDAKQIVSPSVKLDVPHYLFIPFIYEDTIGWALGKNLTLLVERDYDYGPSGHRQFVVRYWSSERSGTLAEFECEEADAGTKIAGSIRDSHIKLRQEYREGNQVGNLAEAMNRLELQRQNILRRLEQLANLLKPF